MTFGPNVRYPSGPITPHGAWHVLEDRLPWVALRSYDDSIVFNLMGGLAIADPSVPERVELKELRGLIAPWRVIDQKGASQDGVSFVDALYDPIEVQMDVRAVARTPARLRKVINDLIASIDIKKESELSWFTPQLGRWWTSVRWFKPPDEPVGPLQSVNQKMMLRLRADSGFWQSYPHTDQFRFIYDDDSDNFDRLTAEGDAITGWTLAYTGPGSGVLYTDGAQAVSNLQSNRTVIARRTDFTSTSNDQAVEIELGTIADWFWPTDTYLDVWLRMNNTGTPGTDGIRWRIGQWTVKVSSFTGGVETVLRETTMFLWPRAGEKFTFIAGVQGDSRMHKMLRSNATLMSVKEPGAVSLIDASHRKAGFGQAALSGSVRPAGIRNWKVGDNNAVAQEGFVERVNVGDQPMWDTFTCFGPGNFYFGNGPSSTEMVKFGPLLPNQVMQVRTDPGKRSVVDMTAIPPTPQEVALFQNAQQGFLSFLSDRSVRTSPQATQSIFGIVPPQGNPYSLLNGRFSNPIPPRSPGNPVAQYHVKVKIDGGNSDSQIIVAGTPLRRMPY